ncbi:hypothetical protein SAMN05421770_101112 [Granulicella rosea]|uniref:Uncharacterized protein n=1 Tax=Granulicella rosea TaxID=474952 RepID=A0A239CTV8_9BACT|nr:hypothetical protein [Granulicella rosea]SNS23676.1 hypothetical protein SAMN05421770_101112 [Granulicella rosea]
MSAIASIDLSGVSSLPVSQYAGQYSGQGSSSSSVAQLSPLPSTAQSSASVAKQQTAKTTDSDQVQLSKQAEARLLYSQGESLAEIEATLGVGETIITSYLGITNGTETLVAAATAAVENKAAQNAVA